MSHASSWMPKDRHPHRRDDNSIPERWARARTVTRSSTGKSGSAAPASVHPVCIHGTVKLDPARVGRDASRIADEVNAHLSGLVGAKVRVTLEIEAKILSGAPDHVVRTVTENSRTMKFTGLKRSKSSSGKTSPPKTCLPSLSRTVLRITVSLKVFLAGKTDPGSSASQSGNAMEGGLCFP
jgi:hypothetical protein